MLVKDTDPKFKSYNFIIQNLIQCNLKKSVSWLHRWSNFTKIDFFISFILFIYLFLIFIYIVSQFLSIVLIITN